MVSATVDPVRPAPLHPAHAFFLAATVPLFLGAVLSDYAYTKTYEAQWNNFSSWLIAGGLVFGALALVFALASLGRADQRRGLRSIGLIIVAVMWVLGLINAFVHARDAWAVMPMGIVLSVVVFALAAIAAWLGFATVNRRALP